MKSRADGPEEAGAQDRAGDLRKSSQDAQDIARLHEISIRLFSTTDLQPVLEEVLDAAISLLDADFGNVQLYDPASHSLKIVVHRGFAQEFLDYFNAVPEGTGSCGAAFKRRERVIVEDVLTDPIFRPHLEIVAAAGYRAVQSTPLFTHAGDLLGMLSTHFRQPHRPSARNLGVLDLYALQVAEMIERRQAEAALRASEDRFRSLVQGLPAAVYTCDVDGRITLFNEAAAALWAEPCPYDRSLEAARTSRPGCRSRHDTRHGATGGRPLDRHRRPPTCARADLYGRRRRP
jgi:GAF domain-containing protein